MPISRGERGDCCYGALLWPTTQGGLSAQQPSGGHGAAVFTAENALIKPHSRLRVLPQLSRL